MEYMFGQNKIDLKTDMKQALWAAMDISVNVPLNPVIGLWEISHGRVPMNFVGGEGFKQQSRKNPSISSGQCLKASNDTCVSSVALARLSAKAGLRTHIQMKVLSKL